MDGGTDGDAVRAESHQGVRPLEQGAAGRMAAPRVLDPLIQRRRGQWPRRPRTCRRARRCRGWRSTRGGRSGRGRPGTRVGLMRSPMPVEPRMSANRRLTGISAPKTPSLLRLLMQSRRWPGCRGSGRTRVSQHGAAGTLEGRGAELAVGPMGQAPHDATHAGETGVLTREEAAHRVLGCRGAWHRATSYVVGPWPRRCGPGDAESC